MRKNISLKREKVNLRENKERSCLRELGFIAVTLSMKCGRSMIGVYYYCFKSCLLLFVKKSWPRNG